MYVPPRLVAMLAFNLSYHSPFGDNGSVWSRAVPHVLLISHLASVNKLVKSQSYIRFDYE
jgi:hypothetical protein